MKHLMIILFASIAAIIPNTSSAQTYTETTGEAGAVESNYASVRGWRVLSGTVNRRFVYCVAEHPDRSTPLRLGNSVNRQWQLSIMQSAARVHKDWQGSIEVDDDTRYTNASGSASGKWTVAWLGLNELENIKRGSNMIFGVSKYDFEFNLRGTTAAVLKVEECMQNQGRKPQSRVAQQPRPRVAQQPQPRRNTVQPQPRRQNNTPLKAQLSGTWIWSDPVKNSKNNLIISTIRMTGNNTLNYCYGVFCWDVNFSMNARNEVTFSTNGTDKFTFYDDGPNALHGEFWEFGNSFASPDARVDLR